MTKSFEITLTSGQITVHNLGKIMGKSTENFIGLVKEVGYWNKDRKHSTKLIITQPGIEFYRQQWSQYRALYPDVNAPKPD
ncbi:hypothetical protein [uncultured Nostoc sp.]|uniref:hypothetical protein n=1 Tax=uncultured Nostoc sp. TaxID=340711 RepID=UPI0035CB921B